MNDVTWSRVIPAEAEHPERGEFDPEAWLASDSVRCEEPVVAIGGCCGADATVKVLDYTTPLGGGKITRRTAFFCEQHRPDRQEFEVYGEPKTGTTRLIDLKPGQPMRIMDPIPEPSDNLRSIRILVEEARARLKSAMVIAVQLGAEKGWEPVDGGMFDRLRHADMALYDALDER